MVLKITSKCLHALPKGWTFPNWSCHDLLHYWDDTEAPTLVSPAENRANHNYQLLAAHESRKGHLVLQRQVLALLQVLAGPYFSSRVSPAEVSTPRTEFTTFDGGLNQTSITG